MFESRSRFMMTLDEFARVNIEKHFAGQHDQATHGNWASGGMDGSLGQTPLTPEQLKEFRNGSAMAHIVKGADGQVRFTPERQALHDDFVRKAVENVPRSPDPTFYMLGGGPASGKTTMIQTAKIPIPDETKAVQVNADEAKKILPEYKKMSEAGDAGASSFVHEESSYLAKRVQRAAFERQQNIVLDGTGDASKEGLNSKIQGALDRNYKVVGFYATIPTALAIERANARAMSDGPDKGRFVPAAYIEAIHRSVSDVFPIAVEKMDSVSLYDNTTRSKLILKTSKGKITFVDQAAYDEFLKKGEQ